MATVETSGRGRDQLPRGDGSPQDFIDSTSNRELRVSEERFRELVENAPVGITEISLDGRLLDANPTVCALLGYSREELIGMESRRLVVPGTDGDRSAAMASLVEGRAQSHTYEVMYIRKDGGQREAEVVMTVLRDDEGRPRSLLGLMQDVTERRQLERQVSAQADLINQTSDAIFVTQLADSSITFWNPAAERLFGYSAGDAIGRTAHELLRTVFRDSPAAAEEHLKTTGEWSGELMHLSRAGEPVWVVSSWALIRDRDGAPTATMEVNRDITAQAQLATEREQLLEVLELQNRELRETDKLKTEFLLTISHELRTPLTAILGFADLLAVDSGVSEREELDIIRRNGRRLLTIIEDILTLAQAQAGELKLYPRPVNISAVAGRVVDKARRGAVDKGLSVSVDGAEPASWAIADEVASSHVLRHLVGNAVKFTDAGHVRVSIKREAEQVLVSVEDSGIGVPENARDLIFEEFRQVDQSMTRQHGGVGIGLTVVRRLVDLQGGTLGFDERAGGGSVFWFRLPAAAAPGG
ncbi:MAG TPA: PAS domain S-box protein [Candidatus Dormibacteraeota bacterium]|nr:PAS domain S-box protein [Candidatus Dormibacteraeota bacterium]